MTSGVGPVSGPTHLNVYLPVQPVRKVVPSQHGAAGAPSVREGPPPQPRAPSPMSGRLLDIRV